MNSRSRQLAVEEYRQSEKEVLIIELEAIEHRIQCQCNTVSEIAQYFSIPESEIIEAFRHPVIIDVESTPGRNWIYAS